MVEMLNKNEFFKKYPSAEKQFIDSGLNWELLEQIYDDYILKELL